MHRWLSEALCKHLLSLCQQHSCYILEQRWVLGACVPWLVCKSEFQPGPGPVLRTQLASGCTSIRGGPWTGLGRVIQSPNEEKDGLLGGGWARRAWFGAEQWFVPWWQAGREVLVQGQEGWWRRSRLWLLDWGVRWGVRGWWLLLRVTVGFNVSMGSYNMWPFVSGLFHWTWCFQGSSTMWPDWHIPPLHGWMIFHGRYRNHPSICSSLEVIRVILTLGLLWAVMLWTVMYKFWFEHMFSILSVTL